VNSDAFAQANPVLAEWIMWVIRINDPAIRPIPLRILSLVLNGEFSNDSAQIFAMANAVSMHVPAMCMNRHFETV
jgi:hypothetical protein